MHLYVVVVRIDEHTQEYEVYANNLKSAASAAEDRAAQQHRDASEIDTYAAWDKTESPKQVVWEQI